MFNELTLSPELQRGIDKLGFSAPTEIQRICVPVILDGLDVIGRSQTGSGKTLAFGIPIVEKVDASLAAVQALVLCPTRELAMQVSTEIRKVTTFKDGLRVVDVYGGADIKKQIANLKTAKIVVATPGRLIDHIRRKTIKLADVKNVVLDEADEMLNMGFREDIEKILNSCPKDRQTVMFSATMPQGIQKIAKAHMRNPQTIEVGAVNNTIKEIKQTYLMTSEGNKKSVLTKLFKEYDPKSAIVFCNTKRMTEELFKHLLRDGITAHALHGDMKQSERKRVMDAMKKGDANVLIATDVAARGIDINDIEYVINFDLPQDMEYYIHRIGRTGRAGKSGNAVTMLCGMSEFAKIRYYKNLTGSDITEHPLSSNSKAYDMNRKPIPFARKGYRGR